jgi:anthranilate synthase component I
MARPPGRHGARPGGALCAAARANPGPFAGLARWAEQAVLSSSPERLLSVQGGVETRPIAGTRPRGSDSRDDDAALERNSSRTRRSGPST